MVTGEQRCAGQTLGRGRVAGQTPRLTAVPRGGPAELVCVLATDDLDVRYTAVSSFIFLRFFAPAILSPNLFQLTPHHTVSERPPPSTRRRARLSPQVRWRKRGPGGSRTVNSLMP